MGWLITLGILVLLAILPLGAAVNYHSEGFFLDVIAGPVRIPILPKKKISCPSSRRRWIFSIPSAKNCGSSGWT